MHYPIPQQHTIGNYEIGWNTILSTKDKRAVRNMYPFSSDYNPFWTKAGNNGKWYVGDFNGVGESEPSPYFYQNLAEAEYIVATFMYMRLCGYPAEKISILTTYNGQKHLIRDVIENRCANNPMIGIEHLFPFHSFQNKLFRTTSEGDNC